MIFTIYALIDPSTGEPRYIGQTRGPVAARFKDHLKDKRPSYKVNWLKNLKSRGLRPTIRELYKCYDGTTADAAEIFFIANFKERGFKLTNLSLGGFNGTCIHSEETKSKMSSAQKGKKFTSEHRAKIAANALGHKRWLGKKHTAEARAKMSAARMGKPLSEETRSRMSAAALKRPPEVQARMSASRVGLKRSPEARAKMSAAQKLLAQQGKKTISLEQQAKMTAGRVGIKQSPEHIASRMATQKANREAKKLAEASNTNE